LELSGHSGRLMSGLFLAAIIVPIISGCATEAPRAVIREDKTAIASSGPEGAFHVVESNGVAISLDEQGEVVGLRLGDREIERRLTGGTYLAGCEVRGKVGIRLLDDGGIEFRKTLVDRTQKKRCLLVERFQPRSDSIRWEIEIQGQGDPWSVPIETHLFWPNPVAARFWTAWGDSRPDAPEDSTSWTDPLEPTRFQDFELSYGSRHFTHPQAISIPIVTTTEDALDIGVSLALSPEDLILDMKLIVTARGQMVFSRTNHRISGDRPLRFGMDLVAHPADWRGGLGWMVRRYPQFFEPPNPNAHEIVGCGAYSSHTSVFDAEKLMRMAFRVNWKASFDFPYMGMFLPPVASDTEQWVDFKRKKNSIRQMQEDARRMREMGFYLLNYFNVTEFGTRIRFSPPPKKATPDGALWQDANDFLYGRLRSAILLRSNGRPIRSWGGCVVMDPGEAVYQEFLLEQARRHIDAFPESSGICIDRMDWLQQYNIQRDDGVSWANGAPARSLVVSWHEIMSKLGPMMHEAGKVIYCNPHYRRVDLLRHLDGVYDEFGQMGHSLNLCALLCVQKPLMEWTIDVEELRAEPDAYFQRHLHMGAFLTAPVPGNDHTILPAPWVEAHYLDYGPLLDALRGKRWVLQPHAVEVQDRKAKANLFAVPGGFVVPVTFGGEEPRVRVVLRGLPRLAGQDTFHFEAIHPGTGQNVPVEATDEDGLLTLDVPLHRGCAMVKLYHTWLTPTRRYFTTPIRVQMGTVVGNGEIRYALDGEAPSIRSAVYGEPLRVDERTLIKMAVFVQGARVGDVLTADYVQLPAASGEDEPCICPQGID